MSDEFAGVPRTTVLPCGATGHLDGCGYRCNTCFAIYGSMACPCTREDQEVKHVRQAIQQGSKGV